MARSWDSLDDDVQIDHPFTSASGSLTVNGEVLSRGQLEKAKIHRFEGGSRLYVLQTKPAPNGAKESVVELVIYEGPDRVFHGLCYHDGAPYTGKRTPKQEPIATAITILVAGVGFSIYLVTKTLLGWDYPVGILGELVVGGFVGASLIVMGSSLGNFVAELLPDKKETPGKPEAKP